MFWLKEIKHDMYMSCKLQTNLQAAVFQVFGHAVESNTIHSTPPDSVNDNV